MALILMQKTGETDIYVDSSNVTAHEKIGWKIAEIQYGKYLLTLPNGAVMDLQGETAFTDTYWDDLRFPAAGINPPGAASDAIRDTTDGRLSFSATVENIIAIQAQMPHQWKEGSTIFPHIHWSPTSTNTGNVKWQVKYKVANVNESFPAAWTTLTALDAADGTVDKHQIAELSAIDMTGKTLSCMILILLSRLGNDAQDTYSAACMLNEFDIHFEIDSMGSDGEYTKRL